MGTGICHVIKNKIGVLPSAIWASLAFMLMLLWGASSLAQDAQKQKPPISVGGFDYRYLPQHRVHSFNCQRPACVIGSEVSYIIFAPTTPNFEMFKRGKEIAFRQLQARAAPDVTYKLSDPKRVSHKSMTVFVSEREARWSGGAVRYTKSTVAYFQKMTVSLISSSSSKKAANANGSLFFVGLAALGVAKKKSNESTVPADLEPAK